MMNIVWNRLATAALFAMVAVGAISLAATSSHAQLIAADSYNNVDYPSTTGLNGQDPDVSPGWTEPLKAWSVGSANLQSDVGGSLQNSAVEYDDTSDGKARYVASSFDFYRAGSRALDAYTPADTYYMSVLFNTGSGFTNSTGGDYGVVGFTNFFDSNAFRNAGGSSNVYGLLMGMTGDPNAGTKDLIIRARDGSGDLADTVLLADAAFNTTYLIVAKIDINNGGGSTDIVDYWVNPTNLLDESTMTSSATATGSINTFAMDLNTRIDRVSVVSDTWSSSFFWDETRFGYDLNSVTGVPEPTTLALSVFSVAGLLYRRRS